MGELVGVPEWLAITLWVILGVAVWLAWGCHAMRKGHERLSARRPNPTRGEFLAMLRGDVDEDIAAWMWQQALLYYRPLTPHPDDHLLADARIDSDDIDMDWVPDFLSAFDMDRKLWPKRWPEWPADWEPTVRNFARFLQLGRDRLSA